MQMIYANIMQIKEEILKLRPYSGQWFDTIVKCWKNAPPTDVVERYVHDNSEQPLKSEKANWLNLLSFYMFEDIAHTRLTIYYIRLLLYDIVIVNLRVSHGFSTKCTGYNTVCILLMSIGFDCLSASTHFVL